MAVNFPNNPQVGETYTLGSRTWQWTGTFWRAISTTVGYTGSRGQGVNFIGNLPTESDLPLPYSGEENDAYVIEATGILWIWDGSSWGPVGQFTGYTGSQGAPGTSIRLLGSVATEQDLPSDGTSDGSTLLLPGDGFIVQSSGDLYIWSGTSWSNVGKIAGDAGPIGFTGSAGFTGSTGFTGSIGESSFTWGDTPPPNPAVGDRWYDTITGCLTVYVDDGDSLQWVEVAASGFVGQQGYTGSGGSGGPRITSIAYEDGALATDPAGGETVAIVGSGFEPNAHVLLDGATVGVVTYVSATRLEFVAPAKSAGSYAYLYVINEDGGVGIHVPGVQYSGVPTWSSPAAGSLGNVFETQNLSQSFVATSNSAVTYSVQAGTLPQGSTLNTATGILSGTLGTTNSPTTYTFVIRATDAELQTTDRQFSITLDPDVVTWVSPTNSAVVEVVVDEPSTTTLSATSAAGNSITYSASALPTGLTLSGNTVAGTATVLDESVPSDLTAASQGTNKSATVSITWSVILGGDLFFKNTVLLLTGDSETFITDASANSFTITPNGDTKPSAFSPYNTSWSNFFDGTGDYLTLAYNSAFDVGGNPASVECWVNFSISPTTQIINGQNSGAGSTMRMGVWSGTFRYTINDDTLRDTGITPVAGVWYHLCLTIVSGVARFFINGVLRKTDSGLGNVSNRAELYAIGTEDSAAINGYISNFRFCNGSIPTSYQTSSTTVGEIIFSPPTTQLTTTSQGATSSHVKILTCQSYGFVDNSTNNFAITRNGDVKVTSFGPFTETDTTTGSGYFDGTGDYLVVPDDASLESFTDFTIECWVWFNSVSGTQVVVDKGWNGANFSPYLIFLSSGNLVAYASTGGSWDVLSGTSFGTMIANQWYHVALTRSGSSIRLFTNGNLINTVTNSSTLMNSASNLGIGGGPSAGANPLNGYISNLRIIKGTAVYTSAFTPPTSPLTAITNTSLLTLQNRISYNNSQPVDESGVKNIVTRNGNASGGTFSPYSPAGWSAYFDGTGDYLTTSATPALLLPETTDTTFECWVQTYSNADMAIFSNFNASSPFNGVEFGVNNGYQTFWSQGTWINSSTGNTGVSTIKDGNWHHLAWVITNSGTSLKTYVDGTLNYEASITPSTTGKSTQSIGSDSNTSRGRYFNGYIVNIRFIKGTALYTENFTPSTTPLEPIANTSLLTLRGPSFTDDGPNRFAITRNGDTRITPFSPFAPHTRAPLSHSVYFDGTGDYLQADNDSSLVFGTGDFTVEAWINFSTARAYGTIVNVYGAPSNYNGWALYLDATGTKIYASLVTTVGGSVQQNFGPGTSVLNDGAWHHLAFVRTGTTVGLYINGVREATGTNSYDISSTQVLLIGRFAGRTDRDFPGYISNLRIIKGSGPYDATQSTITVPTSPLTAIANTSLLTCQSSTVIDNSNNAFAISVNGNSQPTRFNPFGETATTGVEYSSVSHGGSVYFDGTGDSVSLTPFRNADFVDPFNTGRLSTVECWLYLNALTSPRSHLFGHWASSVGWSVDVDTSGDLFFAAAGAGPTVTLSTKIQIRQWQHLALSFNGTTTTVYLNGISVGSIGVQNPSDATTNFVIGCRSDNTLPTNGYISNLVFYNGYTKYTSNFVPPEFIQYDPRAIVMINGTNAAITDACGKNVLETVGNARIINGIKKYGTGSIYFDGDGDRLVVPTSQDVAFGTGPYTVECWFYHSGALKTYSTMYSVDNGLKLTVMSDGAVGVWNTAATYVFSATGLVQSDQWYHIAFVRESTSLAKVYLNGNAVITVNSGPIVTTNFSTPQISYVGYYDPVYVHAFQGYIDDLRITKGVARYTTNFTPPAKALPLK